MSDQPQTCHFDLSWAMFYLPPSALQQHVQHMKQIDLSSHFASHYYRFSPFSTQDTMFNIWTNLASWVMFEMSFPSPTTRQYVEQMKKVCILSHDWNLQLVDPTMQYVQHMKKVDMWSPFLKFIPPGPNQAIYTFWPLRQHNIQHRSAWTSHLEPCLTGPFPAFANQYVEYMNKVEMSRHLYILNSSPSPEKQYLEHAKEWVFDNLQFRGPTLQYLKHVIIVGILGHCYDFFPFLLPCTNRYIQHVTQLGILSHFWNIPPSTFLYVEQMK